MKNYLCSLVALGTLAMGSQAYGQEDVPTTQEGGVEHGYLLPAGGEFLVDFVSGEQPQMTLESQVCGRAAGTITEKVYQDGNVTTLEFSRDGDVYGYTLRTRGEDGVVSQISFVDFDDNGWYAWVDGEDVVCPQE